MRSQTTQEVAVHMIGRGWVRKTFRSTKLATAWLDRHEGDFDEVAWSEPIDAEHMKSDPALFEQREATR